VEMNRLAITEGLEGGDGELEFHRVLEEGEESLFQDKRREKSGKTGGIIPETAENVCRKHKSGIKYCKKNSGNTVLG